jgi:hypothetical protein
MQFYVYEHWRMDREECFYVGKGKGRRAYNMKHRTAFHKAIQGKVLRIGSAIEVRIVASGLSETEAFSLERERIAMWRSDGVDLANMTDGGEGRAGIIVSLETREKLRKAHLGKPKSAEHCRHVSESKKGKAPYRPGYVVSEATRQKMREKSLGQPSSVKGIPRSAEVRAKISAAHKGKPSPMRGIPRSAETCRKISAANMGRKMTAEQIAAMSARSKGKPWSDKRRAAHEASRAKAKEAQNAE